MSVYQKKIGRVNFYVTSFVINGCITENIFSFIILSFKRLDNIYCVYSNVKLTLHRTLQMRIFMINLLCVILIDQVLIPIIIRDKIT